MPAQFKLAETGGVPYAVILGEEEQAQGKVKIKEMGLPEGHPEKDGVMVHLKDLVTEVKRRLSRSDEQESVTSRAAKLDIEGTSNTMKTGGDGV